MTPPEPTAAAMEALLGHREWVRRLARSLARDAAAADDLEQDAWLAALRRPPRAADAGGGGVRAWFRSVLRNRLVAEARRRERAAVREAAAAVPEAEPGADDVVARAEAQRRVVDAVLALEEPLRTAVLLRWFEDLAPEEIARRTGVPANTVRARLRRALDRLRASPSLREGARPAWLVVLGLRPPAAAAPPSPAGAAAPPHASPVAAPAADAALAATGGLLVTAKPAAAVAALVALVAAAGLLLARGGDPPRPRPVAGGVRAGDAAHAAGAMAGEGTPSGAAAADAGSPAARAAAIPGAGALSGEVVVAGGGRPAADVAVVVRAEGTPPRTVRTDGGGQFAVEDLPHGVPLSLRVEAEGFAPVRREGLVLARAERRRVEPLLLDAPVGVTVVVTDQRRGPVADAVVDAFPQRMAVAGQDWMARRDLPARTVRTGSDGVARFADLAAGTWSFRAAAGGGRAAAERPRVPVLRGGAAITVALVIEDGFPLEGRVLDAAGEAVPGALLLALTPADPNEARTPSPLDPLGDEVRTDAEGRYRFPALPRGPRSLALVQEGGLAVRIGIVEIPLVSRFDVRLDGGVLEGRVLAEGTGEPVAGAVVRAAAWRRHHPTYVSAVSGADGAYVMRFPLAGAVQGPPDGGGEARALGVHFDVRKEGWVLAPGQRPGTGGVAWIPPGGSMRFDVVLRRAAAMEGTVRIDAVPAAGARVRVEVWNPVTGSSSHDTVAGPDGAYRFDALPEGRARAWAEREGFRPAASPGGPWRAGPPPAEGAIADLRTGETSRRDLALAAGAALDGVVTATDGAPVPAALIAISAVDGTTTETSTDGSGRFRAGGLAPGVEVALRVSREGFLPVSTRARVPAEGEAHPVAVALEPAGRVRGTVVGADGAPPAGALVQVAPAAEALDGRYEIVGAWQRAVRVAVGPDGAFDAPLPEGDLSGGVVVRASAPGCAPALSARVRVVPGAVADGVVVDLRPGSAMRGRVIRAGTGEPVPGAAIEFADANPPPEVGQRRDWGAVGRESHPFEWVAMTDAAGRFEVRDLPPFTYEIRVTPPDGPWAYRKVPVPSDDEVVIELVATHDIAGTVAREDGGPAAGVEVRVVAPGGNGFLAAAVADHEGAFRIRGVPAGRFELELGQPWSRSVDVVRERSGPYEAGATDVRLVARRGAGTIAGRCVAGDAPVAGASVFAKPVGGGPSHMVLSGPDGSFVLRGLEPGAHAIAGHAQRSVGGPGAFGRPLAAEAASVPVGVDGVVLRFEEARSLKGRVVAADGGPLAQGLVVQARRGGDGLWVRLAPVGADGAFALPNLPPGPYRLALFDNAAGRTVPLASEVEVEAGAADVRLILAPG